MHLHSHKKALSRKLLRKHKTQTNLIQSSKKYIAIEEDELNRIYKKNLTDGAVKYKIDKIQYQV